MTIEAQQHEQRDDHGHAAASAVQELRQAEARLSRRRQSTQQRSATDRAAVRFIVHSTWEGRDVTPSELGQHLEISSASVTKLLDRLEASTLVSLRPHPADGRKKIIEPLNPADDPNVTDHLSARIRMICADLSPDEQAFAAAFLGRITAAIGEESER